MSLIHPKLTDNMHRFFARRATVQSQTQSVNSFGDVTSTWINRASLNNVVVRISGVTEQQRQTAQLSGYIITNQVFIPGYHPAIELNDRVVSGGENYDVRQVDHDSARETTKLLVQRVASPEDA